MSLPSRLSQQALLLGEWSHWASFDWEHRSPVYFQQLNVYLASLGRQPTYWHGALPIYNQIAYPGSNLDGTAPPIPYTPVSDESSLSRDLSTVSSKSTSCHSSTSTSSSRRCRFNCGLIVEIHELPGFCKRRNAWQRVKDLLRNALLATGTKRESPGMVHMKYEERFSSKVDRKVYAQWNPKSRKEAYNVCNLIGGNQWEDSKLLVSIWNCHKGIHELEYEWHESTSIQVFDLRTLEEGRRKRAPRTKVETTGEDRTESSDNSTHECRQESDKESEVPGSENGDVGGLKKAYTGPTILRPCEKTRDLLYKP